MKLEMARNHIQTTLDRMSAVYAKPVFDEWAILASGKSRGVMAYHGPRPDGFRRNLSADAEPLRAGTAGKEFADGEIEFVPNAADTCHDAFMKLGPTSYLVLNHTAKAMTEIRKDPKWLGAQGMLFELSERFRMDPLEL